MEVIPRHQCLIYDGSPAKMLPVLPARIIERISHNFRCFYLKSPTMVAGLRSYLFAIGVDVTAEVSMGRLVLTSNQHQIKDGQFDVDHMIKQLEQAICQALSDGFAGLWSTGDMTWGLGRDRDPQ